MVFARIFHVDPAHFDFPFTITITSDSFTRQNLWADRPPSFLIHNSSFPISLSSNEMAIGNNELLSRKNALSTPAM